MKIKLLPATLVLGLFVTAVIFPGRAWAADLPKSARPKIYGEYVALPDMLREWAGRDPPSHEPIVS